MAALRNTHAGLLARCEHWRAVAGLLRHIRQGQQAVQRRQPQRRIVYFIVHFPKLPQKRNPCVLARNLKSFLVLLQFADQLLQPWRSEASHLLCSAKWPSETASTLMGTLVLTVIMHLRTHPEILVQSRGTSFTIAFLTSMRYCRIFVEHECSTYQRLSWHSTDNVHPGPILTRSRGTAREGLCVYLHDGPG